MRRLIPSVLLLLALVAVDGAGRFAHGAQDHEGVPAGRGPRFLLASAAGRSPVHVEPGSNPLLRERITVRLEDVPLEEALDAISREAGLRLVYSAAVVPLDTRVSLVAEGISVGAALSEVLAGADVDVVISGGQAALVQRAPGSAAPPPQEPGSIVGTVTEAGTGQPIMNAQVKVDGIHRAFTNDQGAFFINRVPPGRRTVSVTAIGYSEAVQEVDVADGKTVAMGFQLEVSPTHLSGLVVTATGERRRVELGNDITVLNVDSIVKNEPVTSVTDILEGRVPGLVVQRTSGAPGDPARIRIRGVSSPNLSDDPIIVIDGVRVYSDQSSERGGNLAGTYTGANNFAAPSPLDYIDPNTVETIQVIKGPSAATMYGQDAASGVIVITTKKGQEGPARWSVTTEYGTTSMRGEYPELMIRWGHTDVDGRPVHCPITNREAGSATGVRCMADSVATSQILNDPELSILDRGHRMSATVGVSGGSQALTYSVTGSLQDEVGLVKLPALREKQHIEERGTLPPEWMRRPQHLRMWSASSRVRAQLNLKADVALTTLLSRTEQQRSSLERELGNLMATFFDKASGSYYRATPGGDGILRVADDEIDVHYYQRAIASATHFTSGVTFNWRPYPWLTASADAGLDVVHRADEIFIPSGYGRGSQHDGELAVATGNSVVHTVNLRATADVPIGLGFKLRLSTGTNYAGTSVRDVSGLAWGLPEGTESLNGASEIKRLTDRHFNTTTFGWYVEPGLQHRRIWLSTGLRLDGGNTYGTRLKLQPFPKLGLSYLVSDEPFFPDVLRPVFNTLRLRIAYGHAGRQPGPTDRLRLYGAKMPVWVDGEYLDGVLLEMLGNTKLKPERSQEIEFGFDADLLDDRFSVGLTGYRKNTTDALLDVPVAPSVYGADVTVLRNIGVVRNTGLEVNVGGQLVRSGPLTWSVNVGYSRNRNGVIELGPGVDPIFRGEGLRLAPGFPLNGLWTLPIIGYADSDGNGVLEHHEVLLGDTMVYVGSSLPAHTANLHTHLSLLRGALSVSAGFTYEGGMTQINRAAKALAPLSRSWNDPSTPLEEQAVLIQVADYNLFQTVNSLRLNSLSVQYAVPTSVAARVFRARSVSLALQGSNLWLHTDYRGMDPNVNARATGNAVVDTGVLPRPRTWQLRVSASY